MRAIRFYETGTPDVLRLENLPIPTPQPAQVRIKVETMGVNFADTIRRRGEYYPAPLVLPAIPGMEVVGIVDAVGPGGDQSLIGQRVFARVNGGAAEYVVTATAAIYPCPAGLDPVQAVALFVQGLTAAMILKRSADIKPGQSVFIEAAGGGVGTLAVQLAKIYGAGTVIGGASTATKRAAALALGADHAIDHRKPSYSAVIRELTGGKGVDIVLNSSGDHYFNEGLKALALFGTIVVYGSASGPVAPVQIERLFGGSQRVAAFFLMSGMAEPDLVTQTLAELASLVQSGRLKLQIAATYPLEELAAAHQLMEDGTAVGKIVITL
jgi:NADPH2:quinone reductase